MGPQLLCCGNHAIKKAIPPADLILQWGRNFCVAEIAPEIHVARMVRDAFNGAATFVLRKFNTVRLQGSHVPPFNGAATFVLRKFSATYVHKTRERCLQWGRNFCVAEIWEALLCIEIITILQWGRNFCVAEIKKDGTLHRSCNATFNGAATFVLRKSH